jgi:hypothetical protein
VSGAPAGGAIVRALKAEVERLSAAGSRRLAQARRAAWFQPPSRAGDPPPRVRISASLDHALVLESRARVALSLMAGDSDPGAAPASFDGFVTMGMAIEVDSSQVADFEDARVQRLTPDDTARDTPFGSFA